jgi:hypothetical protein
MQNFQCRKCQLWNRVRSPVGTIARFICIVSPVGLFGCFISLLLHYRSISLHYSQLPVFAYQMSSCPGEQVWSEPEQPAAVSAAATRRSRLSGVVRGVGSSAARQPHGQWGERFTSRDGFCLLVWAVVDQTIFILDLDPAFRMFRIRSSLLKHSSASEIIRIIFAI